MEKFHTPMSRDLQAKELPKDKLALLRTAFGYDSFRGGQSDAIDALLAGRDVLALMPTGGGKSICFQLPALLMEGTALVISPLVALMRDQVNGLRGRGIRAAALLSGQSMGYPERLEIESALAAGALDLLYVSPERLGSPAFLKLLSSVRLSLVAIDEAHCLCEWGHDFRPDYRSIDERLAVLPRVPRIALTASASLSMRDEIITSLLGDAHLVATSFDRPNIALEAVAREEGPEQLGRMLQRRMSMGAAIVYCSTRAETESTSSSLVAMGYDAAAYHAGLEAPVRASVQDRFLTNELSVVVATSAFGMGVDKPDVATVVHLGLPASIEAYYQEIGRGGRDGREALGVLAWSAKDVAKRYRAAYAIKDVAVRSRELARIEGVLGAIEAPLCRRNALLDRFGESFNEGCGRCDVCLDRRELIDASAVVRPMLTMVRDLDGEASISLLAEALVGNRSERVQEAGADALDAFGALSGFEETQIKRLVRQAIGAGLLRIDERGGGISLTPFGRGKYIGNGEILLRDVPVRRLARRGTAGDGLPAWRKDLGVALREVRDEHAKTFGLNAQEILADRDLADVVGGAPVPASVPPELLERMEVLRLEHSGNRPEVPRGFDMALF